MALNSLYMGRSNGGNKLGGRNDNKKVGCTPIVPFIIFTCQEILATFVQQKYRIMLKETYLSLSWNEMLYADSYSRNPEDFVWGNIAVIIVVITIIYSLRGRKYECL